MAPLSTPVARKYWIAPIPLPPWFYLWWEVLINKHVDIPATWETEQGKPFHDPVMPLHYYSISSDLCAAKLLTELTIYSLHLLLTPTTTLLSSVLN